MSNLKVNTINDASGGSAAVLYGVAAPPNSMGFRNRIINGDMRIDQRNAGASISTLGFVVDRMASIERSGYTTLAVTSQQQISDVPANFTYAVKVLIGTGQSVVGSNGYLLGCDHRIEGYNVADLGFGTANAKSFTLSFWVKSSVVGTYPVSFFNQGVSRAYLATYTVNSANTWEQKTITVAGDTSGTWNTGNLIGLGMQFAIANGSGSYGTPGSWSGTYKSGVSGMVDVGATTGSTWLITGVQLEAGSVASPFERRDYGRELMMCQRYYQRNPSANVPFGTSPSSYLQQRFFAQATGVYTMTIGASFPVQMRASPTVSLYYDINDGAPAGPVAATIAAPTNFTYFIGPPAGTSVDLNDWQASAEL